MRDLRQYLGVQLTMIISWKQKNKVLSVRRFRLDALVIWLVGAAGSAFSGIRLFGDGMNAGLWLLPFLFALAAFILGLRTILLHPVEHVVLDGANRFLLVHSGGNRLQIPFAAIKLLFRSGGLIRTMSITTKSSRPQPLFEGYLFGRRFLKFAARAADWGVPLSAELNYQLKRRGSGGRTFVFGLVTALVMLFVTWLLTRQG